MKYLFCLVGLIFTLFFTSQVRAFNRIEGQVYDPNHRPVENARVELSNEVNSPIGNTKTSSSGRFTFSGMPAGRYSIRVLPLGTDLMEQTQEVYVTNLTRISSDVAYIDFYLVYDKRARGVNFEKSPDVIFAQDIPDAAKDLYKDGVDRLNKKDDLGLSKLEEAIKIFPNYFDALSRLGREYIARKDYQTGYPYLLRAVDVNSRNFSNYYFLALAFHEMGEIPAAIKAVQSCLIIDKNSIDALLLYGTLLRVSKDYKNAEPILKNANVIAKKTNPEIHWQLALLYNAINRNSDAADELEIYLKLQPNTPDKPKILNLIAKLREKKQ